MSLIQLPRAFESPASRSEAILATLHAPHNEGILVVPRDPAEAFGTLAPESYPTTRDEMLAYAAAARELAAGLARKAELAGMTEDFPSDVLGYLHQGAALLRDAVALVDNSSSLEDRMASFDVLWMNARSALVLDGMVETPAA